MVQYATLRNHFNTNRAWQGSQALKNFFFFFFSQLDKKPLLELDKYRIHYKWSNNKGTTPNTKFLKDKQGKTKHMLNTYIPTHV